MNNSTEDEDDAAYWAIRLAEGPVDHASQSRLDAWLEADERRRALLLRAEAALAYLDRGRALAEPFDPAVPHKIRVGRRAFLAGGAVSGLAAAGVIGLIGRTSSATEIQTAIGEMRRVPLSDGSVASVNTDSKVAVAMLDKQRLITLEKGEAWFQVAHDTVRPFVVEAGEVRIQAVGTAFAVRKGERGADVLVTEGVVETWIAGQENARTRIEAGSKSFVRYDASTDEVVQAGDLERALAWRTGELALNGESLSYAAGELNRYNVRQIVVENDKLGREPLVGYFRTDQPEQFGRAIAKTLGAQVRIDGDSILLSR